MSGIHLRAPVFFLFFLLKIQPLMASIDGGPEFQANWDGNQWQLPPGQHRLSVWFKYFWFLPVGRADLLVDVPPGGVVDIEYKHPWIVFLPGTLRVRGVAGAPGVAPAVGGGGVAAGWLPDPTGRHQQRYWDGTAWTEHVTTAGATSTDPVG